jgi:hypothetical protein
VFLVLEPGWFDIVVSHFRSSTAATRLIVTRPTSPLRTLNRNFRDTAIALVQAIGLANAVGALAWLTFDRQAFVRGMFTWLWIVPWLLTFLLIHLGKPGYVLPLLPALIVPLATFYVSRRKWIAPLVGAVVVMNVVQFAIIAPPSPALTGGNKRYRDKTFVERALSDTQAIAFPTLYSIRQSDAAVQRLHHLIDSTCPELNPIIVVGIEPVDWRRVMYYFPRATAIHVVNGSPLYISQGHTFRSTEEPGTRLTTSCPVIWLTAPAEKPPSVDRVATTAAELGWQTPPGTILVNKESVSYR